VRSADRVNLNVTLLGVAAIVLFHPSPPDQPAAEAATIRAGIAFLMPYRRPASDRFIDHADASPRDADGTSALGIEPRDVDARFCRNEGIQLRDGLTRL
jgi:hypothetical protein